MEKLTFLIIFLYCLALGQTTISGNIGGMTMNASKNPWIVTHNIFVEKDSKTIIKPGCIFLFKPFTGLEVKGDLIVEGEKSNRVVFTSINDSLYNKATTKNPEPFDWNGILICTEANHISLSHFILSYSVYGIQSKISYLKIYNGFFNENGQFNFTIKGDILNVANNYPFNYCSSEKDQLGDIKKRKTFYAQDYLTRGNIALGTLFLCSAGYFAYQYRQNDVKYSRAVNTRDINRYYDKKKDSRQSAIYTGIIGGTITSFGLGSLIINHYKKKDNIYLSYNRGGINIVLSF